MGMRWSLPAVAFLVVLSVGQAAAQPDVAGTVSRADLATEGDVGGARRVLRFVQVSDAHILDDDAPYPLRQEPLDPYITAFSSSAQRPQDEYTDEVLESIVRAINGQHAADPFQFVLNTGDNIDNDLENELMRFLDLWDGTATATGPVSGLACVPDGQSTGIEDDEHDVTDRCTSLPESLLAVRTALAPGLPWYSAFGNHDTLLQGNVNPNGPFDDVAARSGRHLLTQPEYVAMHFPGLDACAGGTAADDFGHGYGLAGERLCDEDPDNDGYYAFTANGVRFIVLDTVNDDFARANGFTPGVLTTESIAGADIIGGYAEGAVDPVQLAWLREEVAAHPDKLIVVSSHHTVNSMFTRLRDDACAPGLGCLADAFERAGYATGEQLTAELAEVPNVVAWVGGHTHRHRIQPKDGAAGGFWNVESSSLIDWPQQARAIELWVTADGAKGFWLLRSFGHDFAPSKDLEATDPQREPAAEGTDLDQEVLLWFDVPPGVVLAPEPLGLDLVVDLSGEVLAVGEVPVTVNVRARPALGPVAGLQVFWGVGHWSGGRFVQDVPTGTLLAEAGPGLYNGTFTATEFTDHTAFVQVAGAGVPAGTNATFVIPALAFGCDEGCDKESPAVAGPALLALVVAAALAARRRAQR